MSKWSDLYGYGLEELLRKRLFNYTYASSMFLLHRPLFGGRATLYSAIWEYSSFLCWKYFSELPS